MKKIIISAGIFVIIFAIVLILTFPYADYMEKTIQELNDSNEVKIFWQNSENKFLATELQNLTVTSKQGELLKLDKLIIKPSVIGGISLSGEGTDNLALKGDIRGGIVPVHRLRLARDDGLFRFCHDISSLVDSCLQGTGIRTLENGMAARSHTKSF